MAAEPGAGTERKRTIFVRVLVALATLILVVDLFAVWTNRQLLNTDNWVDTSSQLLENKEIQSQLSDYLVAQLFDNVDVAGALQQRLPPQAQALAGPASAGLREFANRAADKALASPKLQDLWANANRAAHQQFLKILNGGGPVVSTQGGEVVLNLNAAVQQVAGVLGLGQQVKKVQGKLSAQQKEQARQIAAQKLGVKLPATAGQLVIFQSDELKAAQDGANLIRHLAIWLGILAFLMYALAVYLAHGWRRQTLRMVGGSFIVVALLVLVARTLLGSRIVDSLVTAQSVKPAADAAWSIGTSLLKTTAIALLAYGVIVVIGAWLAGPTRPAVALRRAMAPTMRERQGLLWAAVAIILLLIVLWGPTPATRNVVMMPILAALVALGVELLRRQCVREFPDAQAGEYMARLREGYGRAREHLASRRVAPAAAAAAAGPAAGSEEARLGQLERLAKLKDSGALTEEEFAAQKKAVLGS